MPPVRPVAPLTRELAAAAAAFALVGLGGLICALALIDAPARAVLLFAVGAIIVGTAMWFRAGWVGTAEAPAVAPERVERPRETVQRHVVVAVPAAVTVGVCLALGTGLGALVAGVVAGTAAGEVRALRLARAREGREGGELLRELGPHPFAAPRRPLYIRSRSASTSST